ncbi:MAG: nitrogenase component 1 [Candidatus Methanoplasma sp.]|jgi:nitrogenase molybdenum-iron protein alpha/beta subunit|nr:nitrogenase component 1 [Candidatus Methanoplasma sp.]
MEDDAMTINRICMDGFTGALLAVESFSDGRAVLHGPGGCRNYHTFLVSQCYPRRDPSDFKKYAMPYFFSQPRIPCTYIDEDNYINGSEKKLEECIPVICSVDDNFDVFICSPGAALIGDNITDAIERAGYKEKAMAIEESLISQPFPDSYDHTVKSIIEWKSPSKKKTVPKSVNILGMPISSIDWEDSIDELSSILREMGITVLSSPGAGCSSEELERSTAAEYNVCVCPEYCERTAELYERVYGIPTIFSDMGAPVGFDAVEHWVKNIGKVMGADTSKAEALIKKAKTRAYKRINRAAYARRTKCSRFTIMADGSIVYPLTKWLYEYLCMLPVSISVDPGEDERTVSSLIGFLEERGLKDAWGSDPAQNADYMFTDGQTAETQMMIGTCRKGVSIALPDLSRANFIPRPVFGLNGAAYILDEIFSGL